MYEEASVIGGRHFNIKTEMIFLSNKPVSLYENLKDIQNVTNLEKHAEYII